MISEYKQQAFAMHDIPAEDKATYDKPAQYAEGIPYVVVNGVLVVKEGQLQTGVFPGRGLRR